jgi:hypothetical protein
MVSKNSYYDQHQKNKKENIEEGVSLDKEHPPARHLGPGPGCVPISGCLLTGSALSSLRHP